LLEVGIVGDDDRTVERVPVEVSDVTRPTRRAVTGGNHVRIEMFRAAVLLGDLDFEGVF
jgi:hypothetical protein